MRGFTLIETLVVIFILALLLALGILQTRGATGRAETRAVAEMLADEFRTARQRAIGSGVPVGVGLPTQGMTRPHSRSLYLLEGFNPPRIARVKPLEREFPTACYFVGHWALDPSQLDDPSATNTVIQPPLASNWGDFDPTLWQVPFPQDHLFVFSPSGLVTSNRRVLFDGAYHVVVSRQVNFSGGSVGGQASFLVTAVCEPYTVSISPAGRIAVREGLTAVAAGTVQFVSSPPVMVSAPAPPPAVASGPN
ncbi:MAG: prepilin-type N-terminal cleavage/methylation domain-containing protein, partial [Candidatus Eremiobacterota bacterium]